MKIQDLKLEGERIRLESLKPNHIAQLWNESITAEVWWYLPNRFQSENDLHELFDPSLKAKEMGLEHPFVIYEQIHEMSGPNKH